MRRSWAPFAAACASLGGREPLTVDVVGVEPLAGQGMEGRFLVKLRLQNPGETPVDFDGVSVSLDVRGSRLASGVGDVRGTVPRFGETVIAVPVTVPVGAMIRQALGFASGDRTRLDIRPEAMGITWHDVEAMLRGLPGFLREAGLGYALAHELKINDAFVPAAKAEIEARPGYVRPPSPASRRGRGSGLGPRSALRARAGSAPGPPAASRPGIPAAR